MPRIVVIGSSNTDMIVRTERIPIPGETVLGGELLMTPGGKGANQAVAAARLGADVTLIARIGTDVFGDVAIRSIAAAGVDTSHILRDDRAASGVALIAVDASGQNSIVVASGANALFSPADVESAREVMREADIVLIQLEIPLAAVSRAIALSRELGRCVILNPAPALSLPDGFLREVNVITPNEHEAATLLGDPAPQPASARDGGTFHSAGSVARRLLTLGPESAVVTLGENGAVAARGAAVDSLPSTPVKALDTTAAGDCFSGALAVGLAEGMDLAEACAFANVAAGISVTRRGAQASMPNRREVDQAFKAMRG